LPAGPGTANRPGLGERPGIGERPVTGDRPGPGGPGSDSGQERQGDRQDNRSDLADNRADRIENVDDRKIDRQDRRQEVGEQLRDNHPRYNFWQDNPNHTRFRYTTPYRRSTWAAVGTWFPWGWTTPVPYNYGDNVYVQNDSVYYGDEVIATTDEYAQQAQTIAMSTPLDETPTEDEQWLPLGVFALVQDGEATGPASKFFMQISVNKEGTIAGTYNNSQSDQSQPIEGAVDKDSQRAAWAVGGKDWPIVEAGISNLTEDEIPVLLHFEDGQTQGWLLVRIEEPTA